MSMSRKLLQPEAGSPHSAARVRTNLPRISCTRFNKLLVLLIRGKSWKRLRQTRQDFRRGVLAVFVAGFAVVAAPMVGGADAKTKTHRRHFVKTRAVCPRRTAEGEVVDCNGWRLRPGGWDNTCFNLDYLPSQFACSARSRR